MLSEGKFKSVQQSTFKQGLLILLVSWLLPACPIARLAVLRGRV